MASLRELAFAFARFVARQQRPRFASRNFGIAAYRRQTYGSRRHRQQGRNGGLRHRRAPWSAGRRYYGPAGGHRRRSNYRQNHHRGHRGVQRHHFPGTPGPSARAVTPVAAAPVVATPVAPEVVVAAPVSVAAQVAAAPVAAAPEIAIVQETAPEEMADAVYEDEASASNFTADADDLLPPPPAFSVPPMEWLLGEPSAGWLVDDPEADFSDEEDEATPPMSYFLRHGYGPCLPSPTPSDEDQEHFAPPGYAPVPEFSSSPAMVPNQEKNEDAASAAACLVVPDLNLPVPEEKEENEDAAPSLALPTPSPEARVLLRRFASAMAARPAGIRAGTWSPAHLGLTDRMGMLRLDDPSEGTSRR